MTPIPGQPGLYRRALGGGAVTALSYATAQGLRLASNLILARLLFPEAFGLMALVSVALVGLQMLSDTGIGPAIARSPRGDDQAFLNTAWTVNVARGFLLWALACALAWPMARFYGHPELLSMIPVAGLSLAIAGFNPTRIDTATRHLMLTRATLLDLASQAVGIAAMVVLAWATGSVWALVWGALVGAAAKLALTHALLPGPGNRFHWDRGAVQELLHFGIWIFASSAFGFLWSQGDKAIFGAFLSLQQLGLYNIGWFLAAFPMLMASTVTARILIPLYRDQPPSASPANARRLRRLRFGLTGAILTLLALVAALGGPLVALLYDDRYLAAGAIVTAVALVQMPAVIGLTYDQAALAAGDGRGFFWLSAIKATVQTLALIGGAMTAGLGGALLAQGAALVALHPLTVRLAARHRVWDPLHDAAMAAYALLLLAGVLWTGTPVLPGPAQ